MRYNHSCVEKMHGFLAQLAEHLTLNQGVQGSNPWRPILKVLFSMLEEHWGWCFFYAIRVWYWNYIFVIVSAGLHKWNIPRFLVQTIPMNLWKQKSCAPMGFTISWNCYLYSNSLSSKMDHSLLTINNINHKHILTEGSKNKTWQ